MLSGELSASERYFCSLSTSWRSALFRLVMSLVTARIPVGLSAASLRKETATSTQIVEPSLQYSSSSSDAALDGSAVPLASRVICSENSLVTSCRDAGVKTCSSGCAIASATV